jgi:sulfoxide reductase heme-binding subunit YedZ
VHWLAYAAWPVAFVHGLGASPDLRSGGLLDLAIACALGVGGAVVWRLSGAIRTTPRPERAASTLARSQVPAPRSGAAHSGNQPGKVTLR